MERSMEFWEGFVVTGFQMWGTEGGYQLGLGLGLGLGVSVSRQIPMLKC